jgi:hypothetical protein
VKDFRAEQFAANPADAVGSALPIPDPVVISETAMRPPAVGIHHIPEPLDAITRGIDRLAIGLQPLADLVQAFLRLVRNAAVGFRPDVEQQVTAASRALGQHTDYAARRDPVLIRRIHPAPAGMRALAGFPGTVA